MNFPYLLEEKYKVSFASKIASVPTNPVHSNTFSNKFTKQYLSHPSFPKPFNQRINKYIPKYFNHFPQIFLTLTTTDPPWLQALPNIDLSLTISLFNKQETNPTTYQALFLEIKNKYSDYVHIYTDGSKSANNSGAAIIFPNEVKLLSLSTISLPPFTVKHTPFILL